MTKFLVCFLESIKKEFGLEEFALDDLSPTIFYRARYNCDRLVKLNKLDWRVEIKDYPKCHNIISYYKIKGE